MATVEAEVKELEKYAQEIRTTGRVDGRVFEQAESLCNSYAIGDPVVPMEVAQQAAITHMLALRAMDVRLGLHSAEDQILLDRLTHLRVNPETLELLANS